MNNIKESSRMYSLDVLKMCATVIICFHHYQQVLGVSFENGINFFGGSFYWGNMVELFFLISGYFSYKYIEKITPTSSLLEFMKTRFSRFRNLVFTTVIFCGGGNTCTHVLVKPHFAMEYGIYLPVLHVHQDGLLIRS